MKFKNCGQLEALDPRVGQFVYLASYIVNNYALVRLRLTVLLTVLLTPRSLEKSFDPVQAALGARPSLFFRAVISGTVDPVILYPHTVTSAKVADAILCKHDA